MTDDFELTPTDESPHIDRGRRNAIQYDLTIQVSPETASKLDDLEQEEIHRVVESGLRDLLNKSPDEKEISEARDEIRSWIFGNSRGE
jgi:hypothetical protein